jgi:hypothetical protein
VVIIFGVSFGKLGLLNEPLTSLLAAAHVVAGVPHLRLALNKLAFMDTTGNHTQLRCARTSFTESGLLLN